MHMFNSAAALTALLTTRILMHCNVGNSKKVLDAMFSWLMEKKMPFTDNFGNPQGLLGRLMLVTMEREHLPMAKWAFTQFDC